MAHVIPPEVVHGAIRRALGVVLIVASIAPRLSAQPQQGLATRQESTVVIPGAGYAAGPFSRFLLGDHYRDMWTTPLSVPVLSLATFGGGLRPIARGGSMQTRSLRLSGGDGRQYVFRSVDKDPSRSLPPDLRETYASNIVRDLISAEHPAAGIIVAGLLDAVGVLHATPQLVVMPNDERLGEFRADFAGMLGLIEERPIGETDESSGVGFAGATRVENSEKLFERVTEHADERVDARAFLAARLFDVFVGDWDRHADQWRWARFGDGRNDLWKPIPRDRDWALVNLDGLVWSIARFAYPFPQFVKFSHEYPDPIWLTWNGRLLDRRFFSELEKPVWDSVSAQMRAQLSDKVIDDAIGRLPPELARASRTGLRERLVRRRDNLSQAADRFYRLLSDEVEVHASDESEIVDVVRAGDRFTDITIRQRTRAGAPSARTWFHRRFDADETREIRVYLHGGDDRVVMRGDDAGRTLVRIVGGGGANVFVDSSTAGASSARYYDTNTRTTTEGFDAGRIDRRPYTPPVTRRGWIDPPRDWGSRWRTPPWVSYTPDVGPFIGGGPLYKRYGFRHPEYSYDMSLRAGAAPMSSRWRVEYSTDIRRANSTAHTTFVARVSSLDIIHFYGFGNESPPGSARAHRVDQKVFALEPMVHLPVASHTTLDLGVRARQISTKFDSTQLHGGVAPFGTGSLTRVGLRAGFTLDTRDTAGNSARGFLVSVRGAEYPKPFGNSGSAAGEVRSEASAYIGGGGYFRPVLALRAGGDRVWGRYPFFDAAFVGGSETVRGFAEDRFAGNASLYGNAELRVFLTRFFFLLPGDLGAFALADAGRVFQNSETSNTIHQGLGGGLWVSFLGRANTFSLAAAHSPEGTKMYFRSGFLY
jgi:hypothetical protein